MSISNSYPTQRPKLNLVFNGGSDQLDSRISFSRADSTPSAVHYWSNEKHKSSENLLQYSNPVTSHWSETNTAITVNSIASPDGTATASKILETSGTGYHETRETFACTNAVSHTATFYAKANGRTVIRFLPRTSSGVIANVEFTLSGAGSESLISGTATRSIAAVGATGGWYKMTVTFTGNATATGDFQINICESAGTDSYAGDATKGVYLWGCGMSSLQEQILNPTSGSIHREYSSTLKSVTTSGQPRFEFDPITNNAEGLLIESQATNLTVASQQVETWGKDSVSIQSNVAIAPDGTLGADRVVDNADGPRPHYVYKSTALGVSVGSTVYTVSFHAKASGHSELQTYDNAQNTSGNLHVNLANGTITSGTGVIKSCGDGWYRISYQVTADASTTSVARILMKNGGSNSYTGTSYKGILIWGMQVEIGSAPTSYIKTATSATATRSADSCSVATADFGYTGGPVSVISEFAGGSGYYPELWELRDTVSKAGGVNDYILPIKYSASASSSTNWQTWINDSGNLSQTTLGASSSATKLGVSVDTNSVASCADGGTIYDTTSTVIPDSLDTLYIGRAYASSITLNGHIKRLSLFNVALSDTELQALTS